MDFNTSVLQASKTKPVVVDFWAPWCGPCQMLGPTLEQLAGEQSDRWILVKVNVDDHQDLAAQFGVRGIPDVKLFVNGAVVAEFAGVRSKVQIEQWLDQHIPDERQGELDDILARLTNDASALSALQQFVANNPDVTTARIALARYLVFGDPEKAQNLVEAIKIGHEFFDSAEDIRSLARFLLHQPDDSPTGKAISKAQLAAEADDHEAMVNFIIEATQVDKAYADDLPRKTGIALFRLWGTDHPLTKAFRWKFDMSLY